MARFIATLIFVGLLVLAIATGLMSGERVTGTVHDPSGKLITHESSDGWSWRYPASWKVQWFEELVGNVVFQGGLVSNTNLHFSHPVRRNIETTVWELTELPTNDVFVEFAQVDRWGTPCDSRRANARGGAVEPTSFPLLLDDAEHATEGSFETWSMPVCLAGKPLYFLRVRLGSNVSATHSEAVEEIVASIRPTELVGPTASAKPADCEPIGADTNSVTATPKRAAIGERVDFQGGCFIGSPEPRSKTFVGIGGMLGPNGASVYNPKGCPFKAFGEGRWRLTRLGSMRGYLIIPARGRCRFEEGTRPVGPGTYRLIVGFYDWGVGNVRVAKR